MTPRSPDFICIGAQKAGTRWLRENLRKHPRIWMPLVPELHYFDEPLNDGSILPPRLGRERVASPEWMSQTLARLEQLISEGDVDSAAWWAMYSFADHSDHWYRSLFAFAPAGCVVGDITPRYMLCGHDEIAHIKRVAPETKLIFLLRNPVERFWSQCKMKHANNSLPETEAAAMALFDTPNGRPRGEYSKSILRFCELFEPDRMLLVFHDAIRSCPAEVMRGVHAFLGLEPWSVDEQELQKPVNPSLSNEPMPPSLRSRVEVAYRSEMEVLSEVFGSYARGWLKSGEIGKDSIPFLHLNSSHVAALRQHLEKRVLERAQRGKVFCVSMQRSGTTSVGDWLEAHGLARAGSPTSVRLGWSRSWLEGAFDQIFESAEFQAAEILEDDPWWCPDFFRILAERYPDAKFILLERDPDDWFDSMCHHSGGRNPGWTDIHARIYDREDDLRDCLRNRSDLQPDAWNLLSIVEHRDHYTTMYRRHGEAVRAYFQDQPHRLFYGRLEDPNVFPGIASFVGLQEKPGIPVPCSNARTEAMRLALKYYLEGVKR